MKQVKFTRDMRPFQANHEAALPDALADKLIASGDALAVTPALGGVVLPPDAAPVAVPRGRFVTRSREAAANVRRK